MHAWLKRAVAGLLSAGTLLGGGLLMAGTANADEIRMPDIGKTITSLTASAATTYPRELVNGGFDYLPDGGWKTVDAPSYMTNAYTSVDPNNGQYMRNAKHSDADLASWVDWPGFDQSKFAWKTDQKGGHDQGGLKDRAEAVELQQDSMDGNTYAEMVASEPGRTIYQNLATIPGTLYKIRLKHTSLCKDNVDQMQVVINGTPIEMTRVAANGKAGDKVGEKSKTIGTRVTNENRWHHSDQWETYEGYYVIPDGQTTTRFGFKAVNYLDPTKGNLLDDVTFARAYKLSYDKNASDATGKVPSDETADTVRQTKARTTGTVKTVADENVRYGSLANGDFSYPSFSDIQENEQGTDADLRTFLKSDDGTLWDNMSVTDLSKYGKIGQIPGFDSSRFAWSSTENGSRVELQQDRNTKNTYAEIVAQQDNTSIYQNVSTGNGGVLYKIRLKHASRQSSHADRMQVLVGSDTDHATPVEMTRVTSNGHGDKVGGKSTIITTKVSNTDPRDHGSQWETYEGYYQVPEGQKNTVFMFKSLEGFKEVETLPGNNVGNLVDDIEFSRSYKLTYDKNASDATGKVPSNQRGKENAVEPAESKTTGNVKTVADNTSNLPDHLVNGTFDYRGNEIINENQRVYGRHDTTYLAIISAKTGVIGNPLHSKLDNWDSGKFGWRSNDATAGVDTVEVQRRNHTPYPTNAGNVWGEIAAAKRGKYIYQDIATTPGVVYKWSLKHASRNADQDDSMQVMIGEPGKTVAQQATRTTSNGSDKTGSVGTTITTHGTAQDGRWETYTGTYIATSTVTRFTFRSVRDSNGQGLDFTAEGNCVDDLSFDKAYKLSYDKNSSDATGSVPSNQYGKENTVQPAKSKTTGTVKTVADENVRYGSLANGDFSYPSFSDIQENEQGTDADLRTFLKSDDGTLWDNMSVTDLSKYGKIGQIPGFDSSRFAWSSTENGSRVELQQDRNTKNTYAEIVAQQDNTSIYQNVSTGNGGVLYKIRLKHASRQSSHADRMQVLVGSDTDHATPVEMTRVTSNGHGDKVGGKSTIITTKVSNTDPRDHGSQWETYEGYYQVPEGQKNTVFMFKSLEGFKEVETLPGNNVGNLVDDIEFSRSYKLTYDKNASDATGKVPSNQRGKENAVEPAESKTTGNVKTVADNTSNLPDHLVNGTFDYRGNEIINENQRVYGRHDTTYLAIISAKTGVIGNPLHSKLDNWDSGKFGWRSNDATAGVDTVEVQRRNHTPYPTNAGNVWGEIAAAKRGKYIYQDIATTPGVVYKWSLKHASRNADQDDSMQVMIGEPGKTVAQQATRTTSNGSDKTGSVGTTITTHGTAQDGRWETYTGTYIATSTVTRFTFRSVRDSNGQGLDFTAEGNCVDDLSFDKAYKLSYDKNSSDATGSVPSNQYGKENTVQPAKSKTTGSVGLAADKTASGLTVHDLKKNDKGKVPSSSKADSTQPAAFKAPDAKAEAIASRSAGDELAVNGGFDTPKWTIAKEGQGLPWVYVKPNAGMIRSYAQAMGGQPGVKAGGLTAATFAWQDLDAIGGNQNFELHREKDGNTAADVHAGRTVAQTVNTTPGAAYTFSIRHSGRSKGNAGGVTLLTGPDKDHLTPVKLTRTTVSKTGAKYGDRTGDVGTVAYTHSDSMDATEGGHDPWDHSDDWESYEGTVIIPAGQSRTMISYRGVAKDGTLTASANDSIIDDLHFRLAYRLGYDGNGGTGQVPSRTETGRTETAASGTDGTVRLAADKSAGPESGTIADDRRVLADTIARQDDGTSQRTITRSDGSVRVETIADTGAVSGCQVYYPAGTKITLATAKADSDCWDSSQIGKTNRTFYGWSANTDANDRDVPVADTMDRNTLNANARTEIVMPARAKTVYALWAINPTLSYNVNVPAGSNAPGTPASQTVPYNTAAADKSGWAAGDTGKIPGYRFDGWYTAPNGGNKYDFNTPLTGNVTVYAKWTANGYTVKYDAGGGNGTMPDQKFTFDVPQNLSPNTFTRDGYTFTDWKRADTGDSYTDGQQVSNLTSTPNGVVTLVAQWTPNQAAINYNANPPTGRTPGGQGTANWTGHTGDTPTIGQNGWTVDGYTFIGWNTSADGKGTAYAPGTTWIANGTLTLYAQWTPGQAGLTYDGNGATGGKTDPQPGKTDEKINVRDNGFTRDGYTFVRWDTQAGCKGKAVDPGDEWTLQGSGTLYACWAGVAQTLTYHGNGATGGNTAAQSGHTGDELTTNANGFTRDGYTFVRWDTAKDGSGIAYGEGKNGVGRYTMKPAGNDLYAIWKANPATIQYRNDWPNTTGSTPDTTGNTGQDVTIAQNGFTRPGYTFTGWARDRRTNPSLQPGGRYTLTPGTTTLWAQWKADPAHLIYNSNSGSTSQTRRTDGVVDQTLTVIANPFTRTGYTFTGWNTQADGRGRTYTAGNGFRLVADPKSNPVNTSVLYAQWRINRVTLKFNPNGGTGGYPDITADAFTTVTIPADAKEPKVQRPGFRFTGWAMKPTPGAGDTILSPGKGTVSMPDRGSTTVYAQWEPSLTTLPFTGGQAQVPTIWLYAGFALMLIALGVMMPMLRMRMAATKRTGKHMPITGGKHAK